MTGEGAYWQHQKVADGNWTDPRLCGIIITVAAIMPHITHITEFVSEDDRKTTTLILDQMNTKLTALIMGWDGMGLKKRLSYENMLLRLFTRYLLAYIRHDMWT